MIFRLFYALGLMVFLSAPAYAVTGTDASPGTACTVEDAVAMTANPSGQGGYVLTCKGGTWQAQIMTATPTNSSHAATKGYVDAAVASAAGGGGGGVCYEITPPGPCGTGFQQMPGVHGSDYVCCTGGSSAGDVTSADFDFSDKTDLAYNATYTWPAQQITQFDSATVSISGANLQYRICADAPCTNVLKAWKTAADIISDNQYLQIRYNTPFTSGVQLDFTVTVGDTSDSVAIIPDTTPNAYDFPDLVSGDNPAVWSTPVQITGITVANVSFGGADPANMQYRTCSDAACSSVIHNWGTSNTIGNNHYLQIRHNALISGPSAFTVIVGTGSDAVIRKPFYHVFVTSTNQTPAVIGGIAGADSICNTQASLNGLGGSYKAWLATSSSNEPSDRFENAGTALPFYLVDNTNKVADSWSDLIDNSLDHEISKTGSGGTTGTTVWTNLTANGGVVTSNACGGYTSTSGTSGGWGTSNSVNSNWSYVGVTGCTGSYRLYCFQTQ